MRPGLARGSLLLISLTPRGLAYASIMGAKNAAALKSEILPRHLSDKRNQLEQKNRCSSRNFL